LRAAAKRLSMPDLDLEDEPAAAAGAAFQAV
jgi:hypothetical protein